MDTCYKGVLRQSERIKLVWTHVTKGSYVSQSHIRLVWTHVTKGSYVSQSHIRLVWTHVTKGSYVSQSRIKLVWAHVTKGSYVSQSRIKLVCPHVTKGPYIKNIKYTYILNHNLYTCITRKFNIFIYYFENAEPVSYATFVNRLTGYCQQWSRTHFVYILFLDIDLAFSTLISNRFDHTVVLLIFAVIDFRGKRNIP